ncbi:unnamed protein product [Blepharisma stoltei]|uniref:C2 domain-containing protein n=1 Tax=Blepharisma stoltei TaxID=1481888 RepID=A0AAU9JU28_9CILI|nr:unnamed protein product [Blepharisma stoltei]
MNKPQSIVKLTLQARDLKVEDPNSNGNTCCKIFTKTVNAEKWEEAGDTELVTSSLNPNYKKEFKIQVTYKKSKLIKIIIYEFFANDLQKIGKVVFSLSDLSINGPTTFNIKKYDEVSGHIIVTSQIHHLDEQLRVQIRGKNLVNKDPFNFRSPYFKLFRLRKGQDSFQFYKSEVIEESLNPLWSQSYFNLYDVCGDNMRIPIKIEVWDSNPLLKDVLMGEGYTSVDQILDKKSIVLRKNKKFKGVIEIVEAEIIDHRMRASF